MGERSTQLTVDELAALRSEIRTVLNRYAREPGERAYTGTRLALVAIPWFVLETTDSPARMGFW